MKANKAPEKVYIEPNLDSMWGMAERSCESEIEYTRTDTFIEKACDWLDGIFYDYIKLKHANVDTFMEVDNKRFIEDFRNYMKGE